MRTEFDKLYDKATHIPKITHKKQHEKKAPPKVQFKKSPVTSVETPKEVVEKKPQVPQLMKPERKKYVVDLDEPVQDSGEVNQLILQQRKWKQKHLNKALNNPMTVGDLENFSKLDQELTEAMNSARDNVQRDQKLDMTPKTYESFLQANITNLQKDHANDDKINSHTLDKNTEIESEERDKMSPEVKVMRTNESKATCTLDQDHGSITHTPKTVHKSKSPNVSPDRDLSPS